MARQPRKHFVGARYHVICRGNNREWVFSKDADKKRYLDLIGKYKKRYGFMVYGWVIMSNHVHLLIEVGEVPLSKIMQGIQQSYTLWYNQCNQRVGHTFQQRYKAVQCNDEAYFLCLLRYIHQNPVRAELEGGLAYAWSSHHAYELRLEDGLTDVAFALSLFSNRISHASELYNEYMLVEQVQLDQSVILDESICKEVIDESSSQAICVEPLLKIAAEAQNITRVDDQSLFSMRRSREISQCRRLIVHFCNRYTAFDQNSVAAFLGISQPAVAYILGGRIDTDAYLEEMKKNLCFYA